MGNNLKNKRLDIMVDLETLGTEDDCIITQISAVPFDIHTGEQVSDGFNKLIDIGNMGSVSINGETLKWWLDTNSDLLVSILNGKTDTPRTANLVEDFYQYLLDLVSEYGERNVFLWGDGILFDNRILRHQIESLGFKYPIFYRNDRDVKTIIDLATLKFNKSHIDIKKMYTRENSTLHDAYSDSLNQVDMVCELYKKLTK